MWLPSQFESLVLRSSAPSGPSVVLRRARLVERRSGRVADVAFWVPARLAGQRGEPPEREVLGDVLVGGVAVGRATRVGRLGDR